MRNSTSATRYCPMLLTMADYFLVIRQSSSGKTQHLMMSVKDSIARERTARFATCAKAWLHPMRDKDS